MVVPFLLCHQCGNGNETKQGSQCSCHRFRHFSREPVIHLHHTQTDPHGESIEASYISVVTFPGLVTGLIQVEHDSDSGKEEKQHIDPRVCFMATEMEEESQQAKNQWQHKQAIVCLVVFETLRHFILVAIDDVINGGDTGYPVAIAQIGNIESLVVILLAGEIPHEIAEVHEVNLVGSKERQVITLCWFGIIGAIFVFTDTQHLSIIICMVLIVAGIPHAGEYHFIFSAVHVFFVLAYFHIFIA